MATLFIIRWEIKWIVADFLACVVKNATAMPPLLCVRSRQHLFRWTPRFMVLTNSTNFIEDMSWVHHRSKPLMTTTTTDTFFVHQTEAQRYPCAVGKSEKCPARSDGWCSDHQVCTKIMVNVTLWTKMFAQMRSASGVVALPQESQPYYTGKGMCDRRCKSNGIPNRWDGTMIPNVWPSDFLSSSTDILIFCM